MSRLGYWKLSAWPVKCRTTAALLVLLFRPGLVDAAELTILFTDTDGNAVENVVVEVVSPTGPLPENWVLSGMMDQIDKEFVNPVLAVVQGSLVSFPNSDDIHHHVYSYSDTKRFELPLYTGDSADPVLFDRAGVAVVGCNIHDWMVGYVYVGESHLMAVSDVSGRAELLLPAADEYRVKIWHARVNVRDIDRVHVLTPVRSGNTTIAIQLDLERDRRIRRAPVSGRQRY